MYSYCNEHGCYISNIGVKWGNLGQWVKTPSVNHEVHTLFLVSVVNIDLHELGVHQ